MCSQEELIEIQTTYLIEICGISNIRYMDVGNSGLIILMNLLSRLLCREKLTSILPPMHGHVVVQNEHGEEGIRTDGLLSVCWREGERECRIPWLIVGPIHWQSFNNLKWVHSYFIVALHATYFSIYLTVQGCWESSAKYNFKLWINCNMGLWAYRLRVTRC